MVIKHAAGRLGGPGKFAAGDVITARTLTTIRSERILVPDPGTITYREFGVTTSPRAVLHPKAWTAPLNPRVYPMVLRGVRAGGSPTPRHGDSALGLPADFLIAPGGRVLAAKYGRHASDHWPVDELLQIAERQLF